MFAILTASFKLFTMMRIEAKTVEISDSIITGFASIQMQQSTLQISDESVIAFMGSNATTLSTLPPHIQLSEGLVFKSYAHLQVGKIDAMLKHLASSQFYPVEEPDHCHLDFSTRFIMLSPDTQDDIENLQNEIVAATLSIQKHLKLGIDQLSIQRGAWTMSQLSVQLFLIGMVQEAVAVGVWATNLYRTLLKANPRIYGPHLIQALYNLSLSFCNVSDVDNASNTIVECITLNQHLEVFPPNFEVQLLAAKIYSQSAFIARRVGHTKKALQDAEESVERFQMLLGGPTTLQTFENSVDAVAKRVCGIAMTSEETRIYHYALALRELHKNLLLTSREQEAAKAGANALELLKALSRKHVNQKLHSSVAELHFSLCDQQFRSIISQAQALSYAQESIRYYEKIYQTTGIGIEVLLFPLVAEVKIFAEMERYDEAYAVCQKTAKVVHGIIDDQRLSAESLRGLSLSLFYAKRYEEAATTWERLLSIYRSFLSPSEIATAYNSISTSSLLAGNHAKALEMADASVIHCRTLAIQGNQYASYLSDSLHHLTAVLFHSQNYTRAMNEGRAALNLYKSLIKDEPNSLGSYKEALELTMQISLKAGTASAVEMAQDILQHCQELVEQFSNQKTYYINLKLRYVSLLDKSGWVFDAGIVIQEILYWFGDHPAQDLTSVKLYLDCIQFSADFYSSQGYIGKAQSLREKAVSVGRHFTLDSSVARKILRLKVDMSLEASNTSLAVGMIEESLGFASEHGLEKEIDYTWSLDVASLIYRFSGRENDALIMIRDSVRLDRDHGQTPSLWIMSDILADVGQEDEALRVAEEAVEETKRFLSSSISDEHSFRQAQYALALRLFASGDLQRAQKLIVEVRCFYEQFTHGQNKWFIDFAVILRWEGILECASNRHEEGIAARGKLNDLQNRMRFLFPSLSDFIKLALNRERSYASCAKILDKYKLACAHQHEPSDSLEGDQSLTS